MSLWNLLDNYTQKVIMTMAEESDKRYCSECDTYIGNSITTTETYMRDDDTFYCGDCWFNNHYKRCDRYDIRVDCIDRFHYVCGDMRIFPPEQGGDIILKRLADDGIARAIRIIAEYAKTIMTGLTHSDSDYGSSKYCICCDTECEPLYEIKHAKRCEYSGVGICCECIKSALRKYTEDATEIDTLWQSIEHGERNIRYESDGIKQENKKKRPYDSYIREKRRNIERLTKSIGSDYGIAYARLELPPIDLKEANELKAYHLAYLARTLDTAIFP